MVVRRARAFGRNHRRSQWALRRTKRAKRRALMRLANSLQDQPADAIRRFFDHNIVDREAAFGVERFVIGGELEPTFWNLAYPAPLAVSDRKHFANQPQRRGVSFATDHARVLVLDARTPGF